MGPGKNERFYVKREGTFQGQNYTASFKNGEIVFYGAGRQLYLGEAEIGDAFEIIPIGKGKLLVSKVTLPKRNGPAASWGMFEKKKGHFFDQENGLWEYVGKKQAEMPKREERSISSQHFILVQFKGENNCWENIAMYASDDIDKSDILLLIPHMVEEPTFLRKALNERFGVSKEEFEKEWKRGH